MHFFRFSDISKLKRKTFLEVCVFTKRCLRACVRACVNILECDHKASHENSHRAFQKKRPLMSDNLRMDICWRSFLQRVAASFHPTIYGKHLKYFPLVDLILGPWY